MKQFLLAFCIVSITGTQSFAEHGGTPPTADFNFYLESIGAGADAYFLNVSSDADTYVWDFGDGYTSTEINPAHSYAAGIYIVCLTATNAYGSDTYCDTINSYPIPGPLFTFSGDPLVTFTDESTGPPTEWFWTFGDGDTSSLQNPEHLYLANGDYNVCLVVSNPGGAASACTTVTIGTYPLTAAAFSFTGDPDVLFTDLSTNDPFAWSWDFGDGGTSTEQNPEHIYTSAGPFTVCLTATNAGGSDTHCEDVPINDPLQAPSADFSYIVVVDCGVVQYNDISSNSPSSWLWTFPDGETTTDQNPEYTLTSTYINDAEVCLTVTNAAGSDTVCHIVDWCSLGVHEIEENLFSVYPEPAIDQIMMTSEYDISAYSISLCDISGKEIPVLQTSVTKKSMQIDIHSLPAGIYVIKASDEMGHVFSQIISHIQR